jgi:hypothetical protein
MSNFFGEVESSFSMPDSQLPGFNDSEDDFNRVDLSKYPPEVREMLEANPEYLELLEAQVEG